MPTIEPFNPLDKTNLAASIGTALYDQPPASLDEVQRFNGAGVYALYYVGDFPAYEPLSISNQNMMNAPIYVGKADAKGKRKGGFLEDSTAGTTLWKRLMDHASSIVAAENLDIADFYCRYLVVDDLWISLGESLLISRHAPVWNTLVDGFGNHDPGKGRISGMRPRWDTIHPGRPWAAKLQPNSLTSEQIENEVLVYLGNQYPHSYQMVESPVSFGIATLPDEDQP